LIKKYLVLIIIYMNRTISAIIPFYNCLGTLPGMLDSILTGSVLPYQLILIDDGSTDGSLAVAQNYAEKYPFFSVYSQEHSGVSAARNLGISKATGFWISFLDADDYIEPDMYEKMLSAIDDAWRSGSADISGCLCGYFTHKEGVTTPYTRKNSSSLTSGEMLEAMFTDNSVRGFLFTRLFRADMLNDMSFDTNIKICEDLLFQTKLFSAKEMQFACIDLPLYHYVENKSSASATRIYFENSNFIYKPAYDQIFLLINKYYISDSYNSILEYSMYTLLKSYRTDNSPATLAQIRLLQKEMRGVKTPFFKKSKRRIAYEIAPVVFSRFYS
jgi:glycosyltransferase involved in cell wall biosynthesis